MTTNHYETHSAAETQAAAALLAGSLTGGEFVALVGDLGAGKTTFTQGLVAALGSMERVTSPTFTVIHEYAIPNHPTIRRVIHVDFYRFTQVFELRALELDAYRRPDTVILAEWPNAILGIDWHPDVTVSLTLGASADTRLVDITSTATA